MGHEGFRQDILLHIKTTVVQSIEEEEMETFSKSDFQVVDVNFEYMYTADFEQHWVSHPDCCSCCNGDKRNSWYKLKIKYKQRFPEPDAKPFAVSFRRHFDVDGEQLGQSSFPEETSGV